MPAPKLDPNRGLGEAQTLGNGVLYPVGGWDERIVPVLGLARREAQFKPWYEVCK